MATSSWKLDDLEQVGLAAELESTNLGSLQQADFEAYNMRWAFTVRFIGISGACITIDSCFDLLSMNSLVPRPHPRGEEKGSDYNTTSRPTLEGRNQNTIVSDHMLTYDMPCAIYGILVNAT